jgi:hypothetical protein
MYKLIGADQKEYGPVGAEQIRQWIAEGRANGETRIQPEGAADWRPLSQFPEFSAALQARVQTVNQPPAAAAVTAQSVAEPVLSDDPRLDVGSCFGRSFALLQKHFWLVVGATAIAHLVLFAMGLIPYFGPAAGLVLGGVFAGGVYAFFLKLVRGQPAAVGDVFTGFNVAIGPLILTGLISMLLIGIGTCLCILPGIYLFVSWLFAIPLVIDKKLDFWPAMETSRQVVGKHWWVVFALVLLGLLVHLAGFIACIVGWFIASPVVYGAIAYAYEDIFNRPGATPATTASSGSTPATR